MYFSLEELTQMVKSGWQEDFGAVTGMEVKKREDSGVIGTLEVSGDGGTITVEGEYSIRKLLQPGKTPVTLQDGAMLLIWECCPAHFSISPRNMTERS